MLILFDHGTPKGLLSGHTVHTAQAKGRDTLGNGALLNAAEIAGRRHLRCRSHDAALSPPTEGFSIAQGYFSTSACERIDAGIVMRRVAAVVALTVK